MRAAVCKVGLVSPRSTCESIGAETPERSASSLSDRSIASRRALTRLPTAGSGSMATAIRLYVIAYRGRTSTALGRAAPHLPHLPQLTFAEPAAGIMERHGPPRHPRPRRRRHPRRGLDARAAERDGVGL